jgi:adenylate cyclase
MASKSPSEGQRIRRGRVRITGVVAAVVVAVLFVAFAAPGRLGDKLFDAYQRLSPRPLDRIAAHVVEIDAESLRAIGPWPWSRYDMARLTDRIAAAHPLAIGFDMTFPEIDRQTPALFARRYPELQGQARAAVLALPSFDSNFAASLGRAPTVLGRAGSAERAAEYHERAYDDAARLPVDAQFDGVLPPGVTRWPHALSSIPEIEETSLGHGLINGDRDGDGVVRRVPAVGSLNGTANTGFATELARIALGVDTVKLILSGNRLSGVGLGDRTIPVAADGRFRFRFGTMPPRAITSAADLFRQGFDTRPLAGKVILIGVTGSGGTDVATTPLAAQAYGLHVQAQAVDAILRDAFLVRPRWAPAAELIAGLLLAGLAILILPRTRGLVVPLAAPAAAARGAGGRAGDRGAGVGRTGCRARHPARHAADAGGAGRAPPGDRSQRGAGGGARRRRRFLRRLPARRRPPRLPGRRRHRQGRASRPVHGAIDGAGARDPRRRRGRCRGRLRRTRRGGVARQQPGHVRDDAVRRDRWRDRPRRPDQCRP